MLRGAKALAQKKGYRPMGLAPSASAVKTLEAEAGIESGTLQRFLARNAGVAAGRLTPRGAKAPRGKFERSVLVVDEASLASTVHAFQVRTVDNAIAAMEAGHPYRATQKRFYVEISRARDGAELVTDDAAKLREHWKWRRGNGFPRSRASTEAKRRNRRPRDRPMAPCALGRRCTARGRRSGARPFRTGASGSRR